MEFWYFHKSPQRIFSTQDKFLVDIFLLNFYKRTWSCGFFLDSRLNITLVVFFISHLYQSTEKTGIQWLVDFQYVCWVWSLIHPWYFVIFPKILVFLFSSQTVQFGILAFVLFFLVDLTFLLSFTVVVLNVFLYRVLQYIIRRLNMGIYYFSWKGVLVYRHLWIIIFNTTNDTKSHTWRLYE